MCLLACLASQTLRWLCCLLTVVVFLCVAALSLFGACSLGLLDRQTRWCCTFHTRDVSCLGDPQRTWSTDRAETFGSRSPPSLSGLF